MNSSTSPSPRSVSCRARRRRRPGALGSSNVPGRLMPMSACLRLAGAVDDAAHDRHAHAPRRPGSAPTRPACARAMWCLDALRHLLEERAGGAAAAGTGADLGPERAQAQRLQHLHGHQHLLGAVAARLRRERDADGVADALVEQDGQAGRRGHDALHAHARLGQAEVQRVVAAARQLPIDVDEVAHAADLGADDDPVVRQAGLLGQLRRAQGRLQHGLDHHLAGVARRGRAGVGVHQLGQQVPGRASPS